MKKRLFKSKSGKKLLGVCSGLAKSFNIDVTIVRVAFVLFAFAGGAAGLLYIILALVLPNEEDVQEEVAPAETAVETQPVVTVDSVEPVEAVETVDATASETNDVVE